MRTYKEIEEITEQINKIKEYRGEYRLKAQRRNGYYAIDDSQGRALCCGTKTEVYQFLRGIMYEL